MKEKYDLTNCFLIIHLNNVSYHYIPFINRINESDKHCFYKIVTYLASKQFWNFIENFMTQITWSIKFKSLNYYDISSWVISNVKIQSFFVSNCFGLENKTFFNVTVIAIKRKYHLTCFYPYDLFIQRNQSIISIINLL